MVISPDMLRDIKTIGIWLHEWNEVFSEVVKFSMGFVLVLIMLFIVGAMVGVVIMLLRGRS